MTRNLNRRTFLLGGAAVTGGLVLLGGSRRAGAAGEPAIRYPFTLGVASGDPLPDSVVLWTRLAPAPLNGDGMGGMPNANITVDWELASDEQFASVVASGSAIAAPGDGHSVHVVAGGLQPDSWYHYRFKVQSHISPAGRTRTAPAHTATASALTFAFASCQHFEQGWYHAHRFIKDDQPDLVLWLGDYIYEKPSLEATDVRGYTLDDEVTALGQYAHAVAPWLSVFDDHELRNNWAGDDGGTTNPEPGAPPIPAARKTAAFKAWWENMPTRVPRPTGPAIAMHRRFQWGTLARFHLLDTRQFRSDQAPDADCAVMRSSTRTITGTGQETWLLNGLATQTATWDFLGQQVFFAQLDYDGNPATCDRMNVDSWDGYAASRRRITQGWVDRQVRNPVVLTGDVHRHWAADLHVDYYTGGPVVGTELVTSSISSVSKGGPPDLSHLPHIRYIGDQRGYVRCRLTPDQLTSEWVGISNPFQRDPALVGASVVQRYTVLAGQPGLQA